MVIRLFGKKGKQWEPKIKILICSDLQVGSQYAVKPRNFVDCHGKPEALNPIQEQITAKWEQMAKKEGAVDYFIINGESVDGKQPANKGKELWTADMGDQIAAAVQLVKQVKYRHLIVTYGTPYHTDENLNADQVFAEKIGAEKHGWEVSFKPKDSDSIFHISHSIGVSTSAWQYRTTGVAKELVAALLNEKELYNYSGIIRSHAHYFVSVSFAKAFGLITPCWQTRTPYMVRKGLSLIPKLGYVVLESMDGDEGPNSWMIRAECFDMPRMELTVL